MFKRQESNYMSLRHLKGVDSSELTWECVNTRVTPLIRDRKKERNPEVTPLDAGWQKSLQSMSSDLKTALIPVL